MKQSCLNLDFQYCVQAFFFDFATKPSRTQAKNPQGVSKIFDGETIMAAFKRKNTKWEINRCGNFQRQKSNSLWENTISEEDSPLKFPQMSSK